MVTTEEQRQLKLASAEEDARLAQSLHDMHEEAVTGHKGLVSRSQTAIADGEAEISRLAQEAAAAKDTVERLRRGEDAPAKISRPMTRKEFLAAIGWTNADLRHARVLQALDRLGATDEAIQAAVNDKTHKRAVYRKVLRQC